MRHNNERDDDDNDDDDAANDDGRRTKNQLKGRDESVDSKMLMPVGSNSKLHQSSREKSRCIRRQQRYIL